MTEQSSEETPFNMAMMYYMELHQLRQYKSKAVIENNMFAYFDCLEEIYIAISFKLSSKEKEQLESQFKEASEELSTRAVGSISHQIETMSLINAKRILKNIDMNLINYMHKYKMIFPRIETGGLKTLQKRFKLNGS